MVDTTTCRLVSQGSYASGTPRPPTRSPTTLQHRRQSSLSSPDEYLLEHGDGTHAHACFIGASWPGSVDGSVANE